MSPERFLIEARYDEELDDLLEGAVVLAGGAGKPDGGAGEGLVIVSEKPLGSVLSKLRDRANELAGQEVRVVLLKAST